MDTVRRNKLQDLISVASQRVAFHPIIPYHRQHLHPLIKAHAQYVSYDKAIVTGLVLCKHCHQIFANARWTKNSILSHFQQVHNIPGIEELLPKVNSEPSPSTNAACPSIKKNKEAKAPPPPEVIIIDDEDSAPPMEESPFMSQPIKKKRGRKPKIVCSGILEKEKKKKPETKVVKMKKHESKKIKLSEEPKERVECI